MRCTVQWGQHEQGGGWPLLGCEPRLSTCAVLMLFLRSCSAGGTLSAGPAAHAGAGV